MGRKWPTCRVSARGRICASQDAITLLALPSGSAALLSSIQFMVFPCRAAHREQPQMLPTPAACGRMLKFLCLNRILSVLKCLQ